MQPVIPSYRVPVFERLAQLHDMDVEVWAGETSPGSPPTASEAHETAFRFRRADTTRVGPWLWQPAQIEAIRSGRFNVVILSWNTRYLQLFPALAMARARGVATILWGHGTRMQTRRFRNWARDAAAKMADACLFYGETGLANARSAGLDDRKLFVAPNAIDQSGVMAAQRSWDEERLVRFRDANGIAGPDVVLFVGRLTAERRLDLLLDAVALVRRKRPGVVLVIIGDGPEREAMVERAGFLGLRLIMPGAIYDEERLAPWFMSAKLCAHPRSVGLALLHAFGYGVPVITTNNPESHGPEIDALIRGQNGLLYQDGDLHDFAAKMIQLLEDSGGRAAMRSAALDTVGPDGYSVDRMVTGMALAIRIVAKEA